MLHLCLIEPVPASSKTDLQLAKVELISDGGSTPVKTCLRRGGKKPAGDRGVRLCERNNSADTKVSEEGEGGGVPGSRAEILLQPMEKTMMRQTVPL